MWDKLQFARCKADSAYIEPNFHFTVNVICRVEVPETDRCRHEPSMHIRLRTFAEVRKYTLEQQGMADLSQMIQRRLHLDYNLQNIHRLARFLQEVYCKFADFHSWVVELR